MADLADTNQIETRLLLVVEMLATAVDEVNRVMAEIKSDPSRPTKPPPPQNDVRRTDGTQ